MGRRNDAVVRDLALAMFERLRGQDVIILTVYRDGRVEQEKRRFEHASCPVGELILLKTSAGVFTDVEPYLCRKLNPPMKLAAGEEVYEDSVMVGYTTDAALDVLYRIFLCVKKVS